MAWYSAFGGIVSQTNAAQGDRFAYTGREWESTAGLYYYRARFYDANADRFISQDPIGFQGGMNIYLYTKNIPTVFNDPYGLVASVENGATRGATSAELKALQYSARLAQLEARLVAINTEIEAAASSGNLVRVVELNQKFMAVVGEYQYVGTFMRYMLSALYKLAPYI